MAEGKGDSVHENEQQESLVAQGSQTRSNDEQRRNRTYTGTFIQFLVLDILLLILLILTVIFMVNDLNCEAEQSVKMCVPCTDLRMHPDDDLDGVNIVENNTCCVEDEKEMYNMVHMFAGKLIKQKMSDSSPRYSKYDCSENMQNTIKVVGRNETQDHNHKSKLLWDDESDLAVVPNSNVLSHHHEHGLIEIKKGGVYFVYSQLVLEHESPRKDSRESNSVYQHAIHLLKPGAKPDNPMSILKNRDTRCSSSKDKHRFTSNIGGAFYFEEGDKLYVQVHNVKEVVPHPHMNHFGVHKL